MKPTQKSNEVDKFIQHVFGVNRKETIENNTCVFCVEPNFDFKDTLSIQEYRISGLCQNCQDEVFGNGRSSKEN